MLRNAILLIALLGFVLPADAADRPRVASINVCTDQLLLALADPEQILGLSPYSRDAARSWAAVGAGRRPGRDACAAARLVGGCGCAGLSAVQDAKSRTSQVA